MNRPFSFLDLACGDAFYSSITLQDTKAREYIGIDVSAKALSYAAENIRKTGLQYSLIEADFIEFNNFIEKKPDVIWVGFSVHHLEMPDKLSFFKKVKDNLSEDGIFMIYEPIFIEGENLKGYHIRFRETYDKYWRGLDKEEEEILFEHMRESERPETTEDWIKIGKDAGFKKSDKILSERTGLYEIFKFS
jgi:ubiquinone/menaquinone biosynthesis C-methylase UbiE